MDGYCVGGHIITIITGARSGWDVAQRRPLVRSLWVGTRRQAGSNPECRANERLCIGEWTGKGRGRVNQTTVCTRSMGGILFGTSRPHVLLLVAPLFRFRFCIGGLAEETNQVLGM